MRKTNCSKTFYNLNVFFTLFTHQGVLDDSISLADLLPKILLAKTTMAKASNSLVEDSMCNISRQMERNKKFQLLLNYYFGKKMYVLKYKEFVSYQLQLTV